MARLVVLTSTGLADGFRLAGCATVIARPGASAEAVLRGLIARTDVGVLLVAEDLWDGLESRLRSEVERLASPVVMPIPVGRPTEGSTRAQLIGEMLQRAIGFRIELSSGGGS